MPYHRYTNRQLEFLIEAYTKEFYSLKDLTVDFNKLFHVELKPSQIKGTLQRWGAKSKLKGGCKKGQYHSGSFKVGNKLSSGKTQFKKGNVPWNKGLKIERIKKAS